MSNPHLPLDAKIIGGTIQFGSQPNAFSAYIPNYRGEQLYCTAVSDGTTLTLLIDDQGPDRLEAVAGAKQATIIFTYKRSPLVQLFSGPLDSPYPSVSIGFALLLATDLNMARIAIFQAPAKVHDLDLDAMSSDAGDEASATRESAAADGTAGPDKPPELGYIAVEVDGDPATVQLYWIQPPFPVPNYKSLKNAAIVPPVGGGPPSIGGPMGIIVTS